MIVYFVCLVGVWLIGLLVVEIRSAVFHRNGYPFNTLLFVPKHRFTDFTIVYPRLMAFGNPVAFFSSSGTPFTYPAPLLLIHVGLWRLTREPLAAYLGCVVVFAALTGLIAYRSIPYRGRITSLAAIAALTAGAFSFPFYFLLDRANLEGFVWMATAAGIYCFAKRKYFLAAALLGLAASMKIFPGVLLLLFLAKRRYREFFISFGFITLFTVVSLWVTGPSILDAARGLVAGMDYVRVMEVMTFEAPNIGFDHSLFTFLEWAALIRSIDIKG